MRCFSTSKGLVVAYLRDAASRQFALVGSSLAGTEQEQRILGHLAATNAAGKASETRLLCSAGGSLALVALEQSRAAGSCSLAALPFAQRQAIRRAAAAGVNLLASQGCAEVAVDSLGDAQAAAEGAFLCTYAYDRFRPEQRADAPRLGLANPQASTSDQAAWDSGRLLADGQNFAKTLAETPANYLTPEQFCVAARDALAGLPGVEVVERDGAWILAQKMLAFLAVAKGSAVAPRLLEVRYGGSTSAGSPIVLVGKGVTFDAGGISIKPASGMADMKGDMAGAAAVLAAVSTAAKLRLPVSVVAVIPLCENMPSGTALKPGDVVCSRAGRYVEVDNTDAEGRLLLADALSYAQETYRPAVLVDVATLTGAIDVALGPLAAGVFCNSDELFSSLQASGHRTGEQLWRMPVWEEYGQLLLASDVAHTKNAGSSRSAGSCSAAAFLAQFFDVSAVRWAHLDIAGVMQQKAAAGYHTKGMTGFGVRLLVDFLRQQGEAATLQK